MELSSVKIQNLYSFEDITIDFKAIGDKILITGVNNDDAGLDSNGSGKSSIFNSIYWGLFGKTLDKRDSGEILRKGTKKGSVTVIFDNSLEITRQINDKREKKLSVMYQGEDESASTNTKSQEVIDGWLGCDFRTFIHSHYMSSDFSNAFIGQDTTPKERFAVFEKFIDMDTLNACSKHCEDKLKENKDELNVLEGELHGYKTIMETHSEAKLNDDLERTTNTMGEISAKIDIAKAELVEMDKERDKYLKYVGQKKSLDKLTELEKHHEDLLEKEMPDDVTDTISIKNKSLRDHENELDMLRKALVCPMCDNKLLLSKGTLVEFDEDNTLTEEALVNDIHVLHNELSLLELQQKERDKLCLDIEASNRQINSLKSTVDVTVDEDEMEFDQEGYEKKKQEVSSLSMRYSDLTAKRSSIETNLKNLENAKERFDTVSKKVKAVANDIEKYVFWREGFKHIKTDRIEAIIPMFEYETNNIMSQYFDSSLSVIFKTMKSLKKGGSKIELNVGVLDLNGDIRGFESYSMGQKSRIAVAVTLARRAIFGEKSALNFLMIDELLDGLDISGQERLVSILQELPYQIFIISHSDSFKTMFTDTINVIFERGVSTLEA